MDEMQKRRGGEGVMEMTTATPLFLSFPPATHSAELVGVFRLARMGWPKGLNTFYVLREATHCDPGRSGMTFTSAWYEHTWCKEMRTICVNFATTTVIPRGYNVKRARASQPDLQTLLISSFTELGRSDSAIISERSVWCF